MKQDQFFDENSLLIIGQTPIDKSVYFDSEFKSLMSYEKNLKRICKEYDKIYYKPHPHLSDAKVDDWVINETNAKIVKSNLSLYDLLACSNLRGIVGISSSSLYEAKYFNKKVYFLEERVINFSKPISLQSLFNFPNLWVKSLIDGASIESPRIFVEKNTCRDHYDYWSYENHSAILEAKIKDFNLIANNTKQKCDEISIIANNAKYTSELANIKIEDLKKIEKVIFYTFKRTVKKLFNLFRI